MMAESDADLDRQPRSAKRSKMEVEGETTKSKIERVVKGLDCQLSPAEEEKWIDTLVKAFEEILKDPDLDPIRGVRLVVSVNFTEEERAKVSFDGLIDDLLTALDLGKKCPPAVSPDEFLGLKTAQYAWKAEYVNHGGEEAFWNHFREQKAAYKENPNNKYPFFSIIQSSGYGKSRLMDQVRTASTGGDSRIVYLSFGATGSYPTSNVIIDNKLELKGRQAVEQAFVQLFEEARTSSVEPTGEPSSFTLRQAPEGFNARYDVFDKDDAGVLFVLDEVSQLLSRYATEHVDFFWCLRRASKTYNELSKSFFVLLSTCSSVNQPMPGRHFDPSFKVLWGKDQEVLEPMTPFLIQHAIGLRNDPTQILGWSVEICHDPAKLLTMGRPMWHALLNASGTPQIDSNAAQGKLVDFALAKLLQKNPPPSHQELTSQQLLALLACRACLTISPVSRFAPAMVASHMATAVSISTEGDDVIVSYPSEPILALASRSYVRKQNKEAFLQHAFFRLKEYFVSGAVEKGHRGEVIVRLLNLLAMDECMSNTNIHRVTEVSLGNFLAKFDRMDASISDHLKGENGNVQLTDKQKKMLKREGILETAEAVEEEGFPVDILGHGKVCFTHFIHLSDDAMITPDLLRYAYRRTAAIVVNAGRRGIDWIIPVRLVKDSDEEFLGLAGQDKNRMRDTLEALSDLSNDTTHHQVSAAYFLTSEEKETFENAG